MGYRTLLDRLYSILYQTPFPTKTQDFLVQTNPANPTVFPDPIPQCTSLKAITFCPKLPNRKTTDGLSMIYRVHSILSYNHLLTVVASRTNPVIAKVEPMHDSRSMAD
jgi:hypothetical protein